MNIANKIISAIAVGGAIMGSTLIASNIDQQIIGYGFFLSSSIAALWLLWKSIDPPKAVVIQNVFFVLVNIWGLIRWAS